MSFTLGNKEAIINSPSKFPVTTTAPAGTNSLLTIKGFGAFEDTHIVSAVAQRFIAGRNADIHITAPDAAALGITAAEVNIPVIVHIRVNTTRHTSEWATDFIKRGRPFIFEIIVDGGDTPTEIMTKLVALFTEYEKRFNHSNRGLPYTWVQATDSVTLSLKDPYLSFHNHVEFLPRGSAYGVKAVTTRVVAQTTIGTGSTGAQTTQNLASTAGIVVGDKLTINTTVVTVTDIISATSLSITPAYDSTDGETVYLHSQPLEPTWDGKYLEENVRMSNAVTGDAYAISPDEVPIIAGEYTEITFKANSGDAGVDNLHKPHKFLGKTRGETTGNREFYYTLYLVEDNTLFTTGEKADEIVQFLHSALETVAGTPATGTVTISGGSGNYTMCTVNGVPIMSSDISWGPDLDGTATAIAANITAHTSVPNYTATAVGAVITITAVTPGVHTNGYVVASTTAAGITAVDVNMSGGVDATSTAVMKIKNGNTVTNVSDFLTNTY